MGEVVSSILTNSILNFFLEFIYFRTVYTLPKISTHGQQDLFDENLFFFSAVLTDLAGLIFALIAYG